jgi:wyosine [tRNA(Phe)-imidazoG37] synthetase (radical SAM superfamily)
MNLMPANSIENAWRRHERKYKDNSYVYSVISRRSRGISIGININPGKECNFDCLYCQVNRKTAPAVHKVDLRRLNEELEWMLQTERSGLLYGSAPFDILPPESRGVRDIAFSGDGEPTIFPEFLKVVQIAAQARQRFELDSAKLVLLTNAAYLDKPSVRAALAELDRDKAEIWAKLDAGTEEHFRLVNRSHEPFKKILDNILETSRARPIVIQSLWFRIQGVMPSSEEIDAYCERLNDLLRAGGKLKNVQLYTIARNPAESSASPLAREELDQIAQKVQVRVPAPMEIFYGV